MNMPWCKLFNISHGEYRHLEGKPHFDEFYETKQSFLVRSLAFPFPLPEIHTVHQDAEKARGPHFRGLLALPDETLVAIISDPDFSLPDMVAISITCKRLFAVSARAIGEARLLAAARWSGCRIACVCETACFSDLPPGMLDDDDRAQVEAMITFIDNNFEYGGVDVVCKVPSPPLWRGAFDYVRRGYGWYNDLQGRDLDMFNLVVSQTFPVDRKDWVLVNLSKLEYVRASALAELCGKPDDLQPFLPNCKVDLGHALLTRICWASEDSPFWFGSAHIPPEVGRGPWAGDRFAINTMDRLGKQKEGQPQWKDVSDAIVRDVKRIFESIFHGETDNVLKMTPLLQEIDWYWYGSDGDDEVAVTGRDALANPY
ncbi:hypothetical protein BD309DRAFT_924491 [Dichomitus squalens]|uniref:Uncharacterized protein n=1 Tax=Dichomitus squalens TaxID=114155 RepID=A0A4Q9NQ40_9APHY|nr:hypothetical protein BD309DRAFT_924491 [Dichomitus squalens]TBU62739.1 hypothetical protein BD310DRAFT_870879 [Dichomitus squalens]